MQIACPSESSLMFSSNWQIMADGSHRYTSGTYFISQQLISPCHPRLLYQAGGGNTNARPDCHTTNELVKLLATLGLPQVVHSDQEQNFESTALKQTFEAFGVILQPTTHKVMALLNSLTVPCCSCFSATCSQSLIGRDTCL